MDNDGYQGLVYDKGGGLHRNPALSFPTCTPHYDAWLVARAQWEGLPWVSIARRFQPSGGPAGHTHQVPAPNVMTRAGFSGPNFGGAALNEAMILEPEPQPEPVTDADLPTEDEFQAQDLRMEEPLYGESAQQSLLPYFSRPSTLADTCPLNVAMSCDLQTCSRQT